MTKDDPLKVMVKCWPTFYDAGPKFCFSLLFVGYITLRVVRHSNHLMIPARTCPNPPSTRRRHNVVLMLGQRRRRWPGIKTTLCRRLALVESLHPHACHCLSSDTTPTQDAPCRGVPINFHPRLVHVDGWHVSGTIRWFPDSGGQVTIHQTQKSLTDNKLFYNQFAFFAT